MAPRAHRVGARLLRLDAARPTGSRAPVYAGLLAAAALISGFTILRGGAPFDEGLVLQAARRVADGQIPYQDFLWPYGPAQPFLLGASFELFGTSLLWWRVLRVACDAAIAVAVYALVRREAGPGAALAGWLVAACAMSQPTSASPFPAALLLGLLAFALATSRADSRRGLVAAGVLTGAAAAWRLDFGIYAGIAVLVALALHPVARAQRVRRGAAFAAAAGATTALAYLPFLVAVGPGDLYDALVGSSLRERDFWSLPFPLSYDGALRGWPPGTLAEDAKDVLSFYVPLISLVGVALAALCAFVAARRAETSLLLAGALAFSAGAVAYLLSRTDEFHTTPLIVLLAIALPLGLAARPARPLAVGLAAVLAALALHGAANRLSALLFSPTLDTIDVAVADGAQAPPAEARAIERMVATVQRRVAPGEPIYALTRRSDLVRFNQPLIYVLTERDNPTDRDFGLQTSAGEQQRTVASLRRARPQAIVRWTDPISTVREPNLRGRPSGSRALDAWVAAEYRLLERAGDYEILIPRPP